MQFTYLVSIILMLGFVIQSKPTFATECAPITINYVPGANYRVSLEYRNCKNGIMQRVEAKKETDNTWDDATLESPLFIRPLGKMDNYSPNEKVQKGSNIFNCPQREEPTTGRCWRQQ